MRMVTILPLVGLMALAPMPSAAQTLEQCLAQARAHAPSLKVADAAVVRADQAVREARAALSPTLRLSANAVENSEPQRAVFPIPGAPGPQVIKLGSATAIDARLTADYTLYSGGRTGALVEAARAAGAGRVQDRLQADADLVLRVSTSFYRVIAAQRLEAAADEALASARTLRTTSAARVRAGVAPRLDSLRADVDLLGRTTAQLRAHEAVHLARVALETAIGAPLDTSQALVVPSGPQATLPGAAESVERAVRQRPEIASLDAALRENQLRYDAARAAHRPTVSLSATAQYLGPNRDEDYWNPNDAGLRTHKFFAGVGVSMPIFDAGLIDARAKQIAADRIAIEARRKEAELAIRSDVEQALSDVRVTLAEWQVDSSRTVIAREALRTAEAGYKGGTTTGTEVRDAEGVLADARADEAQALMNYWTARTRYDYATGALARKEN